MIDAKEIFKTGKFYWFKAHGKGKIEIPFELLSIQQTKTLCDGLASNKYELCNPYHYFTSHYMWVDNSRKHFHVTDVEISSEIKRKISQSKSKGLKLAYKINYSDMKRLLNDFRSGLVDEKYVELFFEKTPWKPWLQKEWKIKKDKIIKKVCKNCESQDKLTLQHTKQPRKINAIIYGLVDENYEEYHVFLNENINTIELTFPENLTKVPVCPQCGSSQVHLRIRGTNSGNYVCIKSSNNVICNYKFISPYYGYGENDVKDAEKRREGLLRNKFCEIKGLLRIAVEICLNEIIEYLNFDNTKTLCNKCAYIEDRPFDKYY
jgi:hypothetical protein